MPRRLSKTAVLAGEWSPKAWRGVGRARPSTARGDAKGARSVWEAR